jgi:hypothetical protein
VLFLLLAFFTAIGLAIFEPRLSDLTADNPMSYPALLAINEAWISIWKYRLPNKLKKAKFRAAPFED